MPETLEMIFRLLLGAFIGGIIGFERQSHGRAAGFRTNMLVSVASVLIMIVSTEYYSLLPLESAFIRIDPARISAGAIIGVGFLGAGVIVKSGFSVQGLTTAACIWVISVIGLAIGGGLYLYGITAFIITVSALWLFRKLERIMPRIKYRTVTIVVPEEIELWPQDLLKELDAQESELIIDREKGQVIYQFNIAYETEETLKKVVDSLKKDKRIIKIHLRER